jgi:hypothetical protein
MEATHGQYPLQDDVTKNASLHQALNDFTNELVSQQMKITETTNFLLTPKSLQKSLATLTTLVNEGGGTHSQLVDFLDCGYHGTADNCSFFVTMDGGDFNIFTTDDDDNFNNNKYTIIYLVFFNFSNIADLIL